MSRKLRAPLRLSRRLTTTVVIGALFALTFWLATPKVGGAFRSAEATPGICEEGTAPSVCIDLGRPGPFKGRQPIPAVLRWRGAPAGSQVNIRLERVPPDLRYVSGIGLLPERSLQISGSGTRSYVWNGREVMAADDVPVLRPADAGSGRYRYVAELYASDHVAPHMAGSAEIMQSRAEPVAVGISSDFELRAKLETGLVGSELKLEALKQRLRHRRKGTEVIVGDLLDRDVAVFEIVDRWCTYVAAKPPHLSSVFACVRKSDVVSRGGLLLPRDEGIDVWGGFFIWDPPTRENG